MNIFYKTKNIIVSILGAKFLPQKENYTCNSQNELHDLPFRIRVFWVALGPSFLDWLPQSRPHFRLFSQHPTSIALCFGRLENQCAESNVCTVEVPTFALAYSSHEK